VNKDITLILGSGGARGLAHIGVVEELEVQGYQIKSVIGSSMGALVGGAYANGQLEPFKNWMTGLDRIKVFQLMDFSLSWRGFIKGEKVFDAMDKFIGNGVKIEDLAIPFKSVATDLLAKKEFVFTKGLLSDAIRASLSIPTVLQPKEVDGIKLVDGGVLNPLPIAYAEENDYALVVVHLNAQKEYIPLQKFKKEPENELFQKFKSMFDRWKKDQYRGEMREKELGFFDLLNSTYDLTQDMLSNMILDKFKPDILIEIPREACDTMEFDRAEELIEYGREAARDALRTVQ
jgi:NTE family protein